MRKLFSLLASAMFAAGTPCIAAPADILDANRAAMGGAGWDGKSTADMEYAYSGQGMTGKVISKTDLQNGYWTEDYSIGPARGADGFDGVHAWEKDFSGTVTEQEGGDQRQLSVNEGYRRANLWWRTDRGGASIIDKGEKHEGGTTYDVLTIIPRDGKRFEAWFDSKKHLLTRIVEKVGPQAITTTYSEYGTIDGVGIAHKILVSNGDTKYDHTLVLTVVHFGDAQAQSAYSAPKVTVTDFSIAGGAGATTFPFKLINNHIFADVSVNGKGPFQFIFDTGGVNVLTPVLAAELGLKTEGRMQGSGAGSGHMDVGLTRVASLRLGDATVKDQIFAVIALDAMSNVEGVGMPGMVGFETFRRFVTRIDYGNGTITLIRPDTFNPEDAGTAIPLAFNGNTIEAAAVYNGVTGNFTIDTGSRNSLTLNAPFAAKNKFNKDGKAIEAVTGWGVGGASRALAMRGGVLKIGPMSVPGPVVEVSTDKGGAFTDASLAGNIGAGILKRYVVTLDYEHARMYLKSVPHPIADLDTYDRAGMWINASERGFQIVDLTKGAPADEAGLKAGDVIVAVDGKPFVSLKLYDVRTMLRDEMPGTAVTFTIMRRGKTRDVSVTLRDLI